MKKHLILALLPLLLTSLTYGQFYNVGDTVENFTFTDYTTGEAVSLYELGADGGVIVLEWFAWWCPFCANAGANVEKGIVEHYAAAGGNPYGLPVHHVGLNVQGNARNQSDIFIETYSIKTVVEDYSRTYFSQFSDASGQPLFVIINAEADSPSAAQWEVLYKRLNYFTNEAPDISALMRPVIDAIQPGQPADSVKTVFPAIEDAADGWYQSDWFGWFYGADFPLINHIELGYGYLAAATGDGNAYFYDENWKWLFTGSRYFPYFYAHLTGDWLLYLNGSMGEWFYDYATMEWRKAPAEQL